MTRRLQQAKRCQLLTGSYEGATRSCPCETTGDCVLTEEQREKYKDHGAVKDARRRNEEEFRKTKGVGGNES